eukprot:CAMPEP_0172611392 /NCGR_PEP_ID=MMETSP1068-20121228/31082_1 /TAXON_ID=35684 /ORGANISM="Pseudopedinella elastica, Strain CCMP716" /LENGTH=470 /DNA_ID=CAMNT_0013415351 /DNA_START=208 /DNA_END=1617 /DNA_ORIENTATION=+
MKVSILLLLIRLGWSLEPTILLAMIARNEEGNFRANLPKWFPIVDGIVCGIDDRTNDLTHRAVVESFPDKPRWVYYYQFTGFGPARTRVFEEAWRKFSNFTHVLVADPDWEPEMPIHKSEVDFDHLAFQFKIFDRNAHTSRMSEWLVLHREGLSFTHRLHEQLHVQSDPAMKVSKELSWTVREVERPGRNSWHQSQVDHGHSQSFNRYLFDLDLLAKDLADEPDDPHVLYYLGATNFAALEALLGRGEHAITPEVTNWINEGIKYLELRLADHHVANTSVHQEQTWASMRWLAYAYQNFRPDFEKSEYWYLRCVAFDPPRADCPVFLSRLYRQNGRAEKAWGIISEAIKFPLQERSFSSNFYIYHCSLPLEASLTIIELLKSQQPTVAASRSPIYLFGWALLRTAQRQCNSASLGYLQESEEEVAAGEAAYRAMTPKDQPSPLDLWDKDELCIDVEASADPDLASMLLNW